MSVYDYKTFFYFYLHDMAVDDYGARRASEQLSRFQNQNYRYEYTAIIHSPKKKKKLPCDRTSPLNQINHRKIMTNLANQPEHFWWSPNVILCLISLSAIAVNFMIFNFSFSCFISPNSAVCFPLIRAAYTLIDTRDKVLKNSN